MLLALPALNSERNDAAWTPAVISDFYKAKPAPYAFLSCQALKKRQIEPIRDSFCDLNTGLESGMQIQI